MKNYDVIIIGAGPSGIFCAYELIHAKKDLKVLMIEKGRRIENRECPKRKTKVCVGCKPCSITTGFAGAGAFSDGKLSLSPDVGGNLPEILGYDKTVELLKESDDIYLKFGADTKVYGVDKEKEIREIRRKAIMANLKLIECPIRHLGTEEGYKIYSRLQEHLLEARGRDGVWHHGRRTSSSRTTRSRVSSPTRMRHTRRQRSSPLWDVRAQTGSLISAISMILRRRSAPWTSVCASRCAMR